MSAEAAVTTVPAIRRERNEQDEPADARELVLLARGGDSSAFETLMLRHERQVLATAFRLLGNSENARDAAQEVFLRLFKYLRAVDPERPLAPWLYRVTVNVCHSMARRQGSNKSLPFGSDTSAEDLPWAAEGNAEELMIRRQEWRLVEAAIAKLPVKERTALVLRDVEGMETGEVAGILGVSDVTVRAHLSRGRVRLKKELDRLVGRQRP